jgi:YhcH/YjgK/YiaL family protein
MILDTLANAFLHEGVHPSFPAAFEWLRKLAPALPDGRYEIDGPGLVAIVQRYETAPSELKKWETHRVHGDIQYMVSGTEAVGYDRREKLAVKTPYNPEKDAEFYEPPTGASSSFLLESGSFAVFHPHDAHQPGVMTGSPAPVHKVVVKFTL